MSLTWWVSVSHLLRPACMGSVTWCNRAWPPACHMVDVQGRGSVAFVGSHGDFFISGGPHGGSGVGSFRAWIWEETPRYPSASGSRHGLYIMDVPELPADFLFRAGNCTHSSRKEKGPLVGLPLSTTCVCCERCPNRGPWDLGRAALDRVDLAGCRNRPLAGP